MNTHIPYRPDIDGLRAIAIVSVILFHAFPTFVTGGFIGVDIFFVISGYLISSIIFNEFKQGRFSFRHFYMRRIRRLFPALILVMAATLAAGWCLLFPPEFVQLGKHVAGGMGFIANFVILDETGYFDREAEVKPLLHLWSLGVEEQFYIVWPLFFYAVWRWKRHWLPAVSVLFVASFIYCVVESFDDAQKAFFMPHTRFWEFAGGAAIAYAAAFHGDRFPVQVNRIFINALSVAGIGLICLSASFFQKDMMFPGWAALMPVTGSALLVVTRTSWLNRIILSSRPVVWIGLISYPLYLWHWPIMSYLHISGLTMTGWVAVGAVGSSVILAWLTYRFVETPVRRRPARDSARVLLGLGLLVFCVGCAVWHGKMRPYLDVEAINQALAAQDDWKYPPQAADERLEINGQRIYRYRGNVEGDVVYIGDSNMQHFTPRVVHLVRTRPDDSYHAVLITSGGCRPIPNVTKGERDSCYRMMDAVRAYIDANPVKRLVIAGSWHKVFVSDQFYYRFADGSVQPLTNPGIKERVLDDMRDFIRYARKKGIEVFLIQNIPMGGEKEAALVIDRFRVMTMRMRAEAYALPDSFGRASAIDEEERMTIVRLAQASGAHVIDPVESMCGQESCPLYYDGYRGIYKDSAHITHSYAGGHATFMDATILRGN